MHLTIKGLSSNKVFKTLEFTEADKDTNLLSFLSLNNIPIASSCRGKMICQKCIINGTLMSCSVTISEFVEKNGLLIEVDYL
jgi:ferredoxin